MSEKSRPCGDFFFVSLFIFMGFKHCDSVGETYIEHGKFAITVGLRLLFSGFSLILHGLLPSWQIPDKLNLEATTKFLIHANNNREEKKRTANERTTPLV